MPCLASSRRTCRAAALLALAACTTSAPRHPPVAASSSGVAEITAALAASADGWNRGDLDAHLAPYADSTTFMTRSGPVRGRDRTRESLRRAYWQEGRPKQSLRFESLEVRMLGPEHALVLGRFILSGGGAQDQTGWFSLTWAHTADGWRIIHDHSS